jgi:hypothetical protein
MNLSLDLAVNTATAVTSSESITNNIISLTRQYTIATRCLSIEVYSCTDGRSAPHRLIPLQYSSIGDDCQVFVLPETVLIALRWLYTIAVSNW